LPGKKNPSSPQQSDPQVGDLLRRLKRAEFYAREGEERGDFDTAHHEIARRLRAALKETENGTQDG
jgi:hypothetical protein